eukprot:1395245-Amorphochlora_amoeboformis.AAC.2
MSVYDVTFGSLGLVCAYLAYKTNPFKSDVEATSAFTSFQRNYVRVCVLDHDDVRLASGALHDPQRGPYVYALYQHYGYNQAEIGVRTFMLNYLCVIFQILFIAGFGSSMVFGTMGND